MTVSDEQPGVQASAGAPWPATAEMRHGRLRAIGGVDVDDLAATYGTPLYVMDRAELVARMRAYREAFNAQTRVVYAAKALCVVGVLQLAAAEGLGVDVASEGELRTALAADVEGAQLVFHGNNKSEAELSAAVSAGVGRVVVDSFDELDRLAALGRAHGAPVPALLRVTPGVAAATHAFIATGRDDSKFGFTLSTGAAFDAVAAAVAEPSVDLRGLHCHIGSQIVASTAFEQAAAAMIGVLAEVRERHRITLEELNLGGGLGIVYTAADEPTPVEQYATALHETVEREARAAGLPVPRLTVEPGRSIVGPAGLTLYRVGAVKEIPGVRTYVAVDGGMSDNLRPALYGAAYSFAAAGPGPAVGDTAPVTVAGKHCESGDVLARGVALPTTLRPGDLVAAAATGAYGHAMASNYNRLPRPAMVLVGDGDAHLLVRRESLDEVLARDVVLPDHAVTPR